MLPSSSNIWVFGHVHGYTDNSKILFEFIQKNNPEINAVWLTQTRGAIDSLTDGKFYYKFSLKGIYYTFIAKNFIYATGSSDISPLVPLYGRHLYQLWHGWPIKKLGVTSPETYPSPAPLAKMLMTKLLAKKFKQYKLVFCHDSITKDILTEAFLLNAEQCSVTGWPRFDHKRKIELESKTNNKNCLTILYAPTWHTDETTSKNLQDLTSPKFITFLEKHNYQLLIKLHPLEKVTNTFKSKNIKLIKDGEAIEQYLAQSTIFISDFSSLLVDASITKPVYLFGTNLDDYKLNRGINSQYIQVYNDSFNHNAEQLINAIESNSVADFSVSLETNTCSRIIDKIKLI
nr:CDP-glycerol glycerophosphotransferase family protein [Shewanella olleyana]